MSNWEKLVSGDELKKAKRERKRTYIDERHPVQDRLELEQEGLEYLQTYKSGKEVKMRRQKPFDVRFENRVWLMFADMGFGTMNADDKFVISYGEKNDDLTKQIDVFATDGETALVVECKAAKEPGTKKDFKTEIESFNGIRGNLIKNIKNQFGREIRVKFIWATSNIVLGKDLERLEDADIEHFDEDSIRYYEGLAKHLGSAAKYQLLGKLFENKDIKGMNDLVPAIRGKMGGHTYYSFSIEPERLLKIGYVLHRDDANRSMMPTYQRIIKKSRLNSIRKFIDEGGYFPNSIVISIDSRGKGLQFDIKSSNSDGISKLGILHLPKQYRSAYIIDGQHRLYGYSDSEYATKNTIPVVAFEDLSQDEQIRLFMEINENQKAVSKNLRNTLNADLLWKSDDYNERRKALRLRIAEALGERQDSPLYERILIGENTKTDTCCVTMDTIDDGIKYGKFLTTFSNNSPADQLGIFDCADGDNDFAFNNLLPFLFAAFEYFKTSLPGEWDVGEAEQGILTNNTGINALLRVFSDVLEYVIDETGMHPKQLEASSIVEMCKPMFSAIVDFYKSLSPELRDEIKHQYGGKGVTKHWRYFQYAIRKKYPGFNPPGLDQWWADNSKQYNEEAKDKLKKISDVVREWVWDFLSEENRPLPYALDVNLYKRAQKQFIEEGRQASPGLRDKWDHANLKDCIEIANYKSYWSEGLIDILTRPEDRNHRASKAVKMKWLDDMQKIANGLTKPGYSVKSSDYEYISSIYNWVSSVPTEE